MNRTWLISYSVTIQMLKPPVSRSMTFGEFVDTDRKIDRNFLTEFCKSRENRISLDCFSDYPEESTLTVSVSPVAATLMES